MTPHRLLVRELASVALAITAVTTLVLVLVLLRGDRAPDSSRASDRSAAFGARLYEQKGCCVCHTIDGTPRIGPTFLHDYGSLIVLADGQQVTVDDAYIAESIRAPQAKARPGYPPSMPVFDSSTVKPNEVAALTAYIRSLQ